MLSRFRLAAPTILPLLVLHLKTSVLPKDPVPSNSAVGWVQESGAGAAITALTVVLLSLTATTAPLVQPLAWSVTSRA